MGRGRRVTAAVTVLRSPSRMTKVSAIVPVFNPGSDIDDCIDSLLGQTLPAEELELIFVDDGSTDGTPARLDELAARAQPREGRSTSPTRAGRASRATSASTWPGASTCSSSTTTTGSSATRSSACTRWPSRIERTSSSARSSATASDVPAADLRVQPARGPLRLRQAAEPAHAAQAVPPPLPRRARPALPRGQAAAGGPPVRGVGLLRGGADLRARGPTRSTTGRAASGRRPPPRERFDAAGYFDNVREVLDLVEARHAAGARARRADAALVPRQDAQARRRTQLAVARGGLPARALRGGPPARPRALRRGASTSACRSTCACGRSCCGAGTTTPWGGSRASSAGSRPWCASAGSSGAARTSCCGWSRGSARRARGCASSATASGRSGSRRPTTLAAAVPQEDREVTGELRRASAEVVLRNLEDETEYLLPARTEVQIAAQRERPRDPAPAHRRADRADRRGGRRPAAARAAGRCTSRSGWPGSGARRLCRARASR